MPVTGNKSDGYTYTCPRCGFVSRRHPVKKDAEARGTEHENEHEED